MMPGSKLLVFLSIVAALVVAATFYDAVGPTEQERGAAATARTAEASASAGTVTPSYGPPGARPRPRMERVSYSEFLDAAVAGEIGAATAAGGELTATRPDGVVVRAWVPDGARPAAELRQAGVDVSGAAPRRRSDGAGGFPWMFALVALGLVGWWAYRNRRIGGGKQGQGEDKLADMRKSTGKLLTEDSRTALFADVAGCDGAKAELEEVVDFLGNPEKYTDLGARTPRGVLLSGPPGTGKTLLARAVAGEAGVPFYAVSGSGFTEMYVGVGASRVRDMFAEAKKNAPCIVFIDEIDTIGKHRGHGGGGAGDERDQTLNQLLAEMDGFETNEGVILMGATNLPECLDPALVRPGRFDRRVDVPNPDVTGREQILRVHAKRVPLAPGVSLRRIARATPGFSGADLANIVNEAALFAAREGARSVTSRHFEAAGDKVRMGAERRGLAIGERDRRLIAAHEAGHAIVGLFVPGNDPLHKVTVIPRGGAMGFAMWVPEGDRWGWSVRELTGRIAMAFGGRVAEELVFGPDEVTSGAQGDIRTATGMARRMVAEWGMSEAVGPLDLATDPATGRAPEVSGELRAQVEAEVRRLLEEGRTRARAAIEENREAFDLLREALIEYETLSGEEIDRVIKGQPPYRPEADVGCPSARMPTSGGVGAAVAEAPAA